MPSEARAFSTQQLVAVSRVQEIQFQVINQDRHPFIRLPSETLSSIYFYLKFCTFLPGSTALSMALGEGHSKSLFCSLECQLRALHFCSSFCWVALLTDVVIGNGMQLAHGLYIMKNWEAQRFSLHWVNVLTTNLCIFALLKLLKVIILLLD